MGSLTIRNIIPQGFFGIVEYNSIHSKTYCKNTDCVAEVMQVKNFLALAKNIAKHMLAMLKTGNYKVIKVKQWRHRCGLQPRYYAMYVMKSGTRIAIYYGNGTWNLLMTSDGSVLKIYTDGCYSVRDAEEILTAIASEDIKRFISSPYLDDDEVF